MGFIPGMKCFHIHKTMNIIQSINRFYEENSCDLSICRKGTRQNSPPFHDLKKNNKTKNKAYKNRRKISQHDKSFFL